MAEPPKALRGATPDERGLTRVPIGKAGVIFSQEPSLGDGDVADEADGHEVGR